MTTTLDLEAIKTRQQATWASGDFSVVASRIALVSELLADAAELRAGWHVLDVATGSGNSAIAAARYGTHVVGTDYVPTLLEDARVRAAGEGLAVEFVEGDAEALPVEDHTFDATLSTFGVMFAPDQKRAASELVRATRSGGTIGLASWTPEGFIGELFRTTSRHAPPPAGLASPMLWGVEDHVRDLLGTAVATIRSELRTCTFRYESASQFVSFFRRWYGPTLKAFESLDETGRRDLEADLVRLVDEWDTWRDGQSVAIPARYLESVVTLC
jgi:ubiquinone/menaquinone biosynthesis C-methylase UbiE